jgi:hypothetical protein
MEQIAASERAVSAQQIVVRPYPPSWVDRLTDWVERLPGPAWLYYLGLALVLLLIRTIIAWSDGSLPVGTFFPAHLYNVSAGALILFVLQYLDDRAGADLSDFRPVLNVGPDGTRDAGYERLRYQLTTMPARPVLLWSLVGLVFGVVAQPFITPEAQRQSLMLFTSPTATGVDLGLAGLNLMMTVVLFYHTIRQLRLVSRIYTQHTNVNIFETGPLYALSRVTAITAVALLFFFYLNITLRSQLQGAGPAIAGGATILLAVAAFVWPLFGGHTLLQQEKARWKGEVARRMEAVARELHRRTDAGDYSEMANMNDAIDSLVKERGVLDKVSTWPWEPETLRVVVTALLLPVVYWIATRVLERLGF